MQVLESWLPDSGVRQQDALGRGTTDARWHATAPEGQHPRHRIICDVLSVTLCNSAACPYCVAGKNWCALARLRTVRGSCQPHPWVVQYIRKAVESAESRSQLPFGSWQFFVDHGNFFVDHGSFLHLSMNLTCWFGASVSCRTDSQRLGECGHKASGCLCSASDKCLRCQPNAVRAVS